MKKPLVWCAQVLLAAAMLSPFNAIAEPALVVLVRHAERSGEPAKDPALSAAGERRADVLLRALEHAEIGTIITTQFRRTRETAQPLAKHLQLQPLVIAARRDALEAHVPEVVTAIRQQTGNVLVVGHSNTVAQIAVALGAPAMPDLCETTFGLALLLQPKTKGAALMRLRYGEADAAPQQGCQ